MKLNILIVCQYFPPYNTPRSYRAYELSSELARQGHNVVVKGLIGSYDYSQIEMDNFHVESLGKSRFGNVNADGVRNQNFIYRLISRYCSYFEFPAIELIWMVEKEISSIVLDYDLVISIAFPYPIHWGVAKVMNKIPSLEKPVWISDCGDPYMGNPMTKKFFLYKYLEKWWGGLTDFITIPVESAKEAYYPDVRNKIEVIPQGFDLSKIEIETYTPNKIITFTYAGKIYPGTRDPSNFIDYLITKEIDFEFHIYTDDICFFDKYKNALEGKLKIHSYIPRLDLIKVLSRSDFIVNIQNTGTVQAPSKLIDYTLSRRPIINITSEFTEHHIVDEFLSRNYGNKMKPLNLEDFDIKTIAKKFLNLYNKKQTNFSSNE